MNTTPEEDRANGIKAIEFFHNYSRSNFPLKYNISFEELKNIIDTRGKSSLAGLGLGIAMTGMAWGKVREAMENLAKEAQGDIPSTNNSFNMALSNRLQEIDFDAISEITMNSAKDLVKHSQNIGDKVLTGVQGAFDLVGGAKIAIPMLIMGYFATKAYAVSKKKK